MSHAIKLSNHELYKDAQVNSKVFNRSVAKQIEHWARIGKIAEENPDLNYFFIQQILIGIEEMKSGETEPYKFG